MSDSRQSQAARETQDVKILQKVNAAHREAFREKFPGQIEHAMRLTAERLQACLQKNEHTVLGRPDTWAASTDDILNLARSLESLWIIHTEQREHNDLDHTSRR